MDGGEREACSIRHVAAREVRRWSEGLARAPPIFLGNFRRFCYAESRGYVKRTGLRHLTILVSRGVHISPPSAIPILTDQVIR